MMISATEPACRARALCLVDEVIVIASKRIISTAREVLGLESNQKLQMPYSS